MSVVPTPTSWTVKALILWTADHLRKQGIESPRLEAELLLAHAMKCKRIDLMIRFLEEPTPAERASYRELVKKRADHWPTAYLVGEREFYLLAYEVTPATLIPRPDTETLVGEALEQFKTRSIVNVLDLGTGSGCIAISIAHRQTSVKVVAVDLSPDALEVAKRNAERHGVAERIDFRQGDLYAALKPSEQFDLIVSNPPYITPTELADLAKEVRDHEPRLALDGGPDGLAFYRRIAMGATTYLSATGSLILEIGSTQADAVIEIFTSSGQFEVFPVKKDQAGRARVVVAHRRG